MVEGWAWVMREVWGIVQGYEMREWELYGEARASE